MPIYGIYPAESMPGSIPLASGGSKGQMFAMVDAETGDQAAEIAVRNGNMQAGEMHVIDLTDAPKFKVEIESTVTVVEE